MNKNLNKTNLKTKVADFCKDDQGKLTLAQKPNIPIIAWLSLRILSEIFKDEAIKSGLLNLSKALLFTWAYLEVTKGDSNFRKLLGLIILISLILSFF